MRFSGKVYKDGKYWLAEIPILDLMTQGRTKKEAYEMVVDMLETIVNKDGFSVEVYRIGKDTYNLRYKLGEDLRFLGRLGAPSVLVKEIIISGL